MTFWNWIITALILIIAVASAALMKVEDLTVVALLAGPVIAIRVSEILAERKEIRERKLKIFRALMTTRATALSPLHVEALNMIDLEFNPRDKRDKPILLAWKVYLDHLNERGVAQDIWNSKRLDLFLDLLYAMAVRLGYDEFDKVHLKNASYIPEAHGMIESDQSAIRKGLADLLTGKVPLPMKITEIPIIRSHQQVDEK